MLTGQISFRNSIAIVQIRTGWLKGAGNMPFDKLLDKVASAQSGAVLFDLQNAGRLRVSDLGKLVDAAVALRRFRVKG